MAAITRIVSSLGLLLVLGCAPGNAQWRREAALTEVVWIGAGDEKCSPPAPYPSLRACLPHDSAYELARRARQCMPWLDDAERAALTSEQARAIADTNLMSAMLYDGQPGFWAGTYYRFTRWFGWYSWHFGKEDCGTP